MDPTAASWTGTISVLHENKCKQLWGLKGVRHQPLPTFRKLAISHKHNAGWVKDRPFLWYVLVMSQPMCSSHSLQKWLSIDSLFPLCDLYHLCGEAEPKLSSLSGNIPAWMVYSVQDRVRWTTFHVKRKAVCKFKMPTMVSIDVKRRTRSIWLMSQQHMFCCVCVHVGFSLQLSTVN